MRVYLIKHITNLSIIRPIVEIALIAIQDAEKKLHEKFAALQKMIEEEKPTYSNQGCTRNMNIVRNMHATSGICEQTTKSQNSRTTEGTIVRRRAESNQE